MTATCPNGHASATDDYCEQCGARIAGADPPPAEPTRVLESVDATEPCPACSTPRSAGEHFCEACGYDFAGARRQPAPALGASWEVVVSADREQFERVAAADLAFPDTAVPRVVALDRTELRIGRHSKAQGTRPDIDLATAPEDPAVSHAHAMLVRQDDGSYAVVDLGSTNGTTLNDLAEPIAANTQVPLADGDRIRLGAWTALTVRAVRRTN